MTRGVPRGDNDPMPQESFSFSPEPPDPERPAEDAGALRRAARRAAAAPQAPRSEPPGPEPPGPEPAGEREAKPPEPPAFTVSELTRAVLERLRGLGRVRVEGEVSGLKRSSAGHVYFDLKDQGAVLSCAVWRSVLERSVRTLPADGSQVLVHGVLDVWGGRYKLQVDRVEPLGAGALLARLEELKAELRAKGWFERRRPLPRFPRAIGLVTSRDGAALRDFLRTRSQRWPLYPVRLCHASVQGAGAAREVAAAIRALEASGADVVVVARGGGSLEDLWTFNEREVAEAIRACGVPVVSAVGHESDTCLSDLVADHRAHTPTDAAQTVIPDRAELCGRVLRAGSRLGAAAWDALDARRAALERLARSRTLAEPERLLSRRAGELRTARARLESASRRLLGDGRERLERARRGLERGRPALRISRASARLADAAARLGRAAERGLADRARRVAVAARTLEAVSPLRVLGRGYSLTSRQGGGVLRDAADVRAGERVETRLARGRLVSRVEEVRPEPADGGGGA